MKTNIKIIIGVAIGILISIVSCYALAENLINSKDVVYEDNSNLVADNVQDAIDGTCSKIDTRLSDIEDNLYKVKDISASTTITATTDLSYTGLYITFPAKSYCSITVIALYQHAPATAIALSTSSTNLGGNVVAYNSTTDNFHVSLSYNMYQEGDNNYYIWAKYTGANTNIITYRGFCATKYK